VEVFFDFWHTNPWLIQTWESQRCRLTRYRLTRYRLKPEIYVDDHVHMHIYVEIPLGDKAMAMRERFID